MSNAQPDQDVDAGTHAVARGHAMASFNYSALRERANIAQRHAAAACIRSSNLLGELTARGAEIRLTLRSRVLVPAQLESRSREHPDSRRPPGELFDVQIRSKLASLNRGSRFRFTGLYHFDGQHMENVHLFDRENPELCLGGKPSPVEAEFFDEIIRGSDAAFTIEEGSLVSRGFARSWVAVPIRSRAGRLCGAVCHYDYRARLISADELATLQFVAAGLDRFWTGVRTIGLLS